MDSVLVDRAGGVVTVTVNRPEKKNAADFPTFDALAAAFTEIAHNTDDRVVVVTGAGTDFCSGADLWGDDGQKVPWIVRMRRVHAAALALQRLPQPTIAKVRGVAVGAGANLALGCDLVVASDTTRFCEIFSKRGLSLDFGGTWLLPRRVGLHVAKELAFFAEMLPAAELERLGLVNRVVADGDLDAFVDDWARRLALAPPIAVAQTKRMLDHAATLTFEQALDAESAAQTVNFGSKDTDEALRAFSEKRDPVFRGH